MDHGRVPAALGGVAVPRATGRTIIPEARVRVSDSLRPETRWHLRELEGPGAPDVSCGKPDASSGETVNAQITALAGQLSVAPIVARLLWLRGIRTDARARKFLSPKMADLSPPEGLPDLDKATERLVRALRDGERVAICGDYDVDGMTGTSLLVRFLQLAGERENVTWSIPDREKDGYGLTVEAIERHAANGVTVAVTVDNGSSAVESIQRAVELGIDVIVTDHTICLETFLFIKISILNFKNENVVQRHM